MADSHTDRIDILDYARFFAAFLVMGFHLFFVGVNHSFGYSDGWSQIFQFGYIGVELFFMISGYVIFYSAQQRTAAQFLSARVLRLYPAFLAALIFTTGVVYFFGAASEMIKPLQFLKNLTMFPTAMGDKDVDPSYWTLRLEIWFYAIVSLFIFTNVSVILKRFFLAWPIIIVIAQFTPFHADPLLSPLFIYFSAGTLFAIHRIQPGWLPKLLLGICYVESLHGAGILTDPWQTQSKVILLAITAFYAFFILLSLPTVTRLRLPAARLVGAVTYPVYLIHQFVGVIILRTLATSTNKVAVTFGTMAVMLSVAYLLHRVVEVNGKAISKRVINKLVGGPIAYVERALNRRPGCMGSAPDPSHHIR